LFEGPAVNSWQFAFDAVFIPIVGIDPEGALAGEVFEIASKRETWNDGLVEISMDWGIHCKRDGIWGAFDPDFGDAGFGVGSV